MTTNCVFCKIVKKDAKATIKYESDDLIIFNDIKPAAKHHYLSVPKEHLKNVNSLNTHEHKNLCM